MKLTIDVRRKGQNNEEKSNNSCTTKKYITVFYTEDEPLSLNTYMQFVIVITVMQISILCDVGFEV